MIKRLPLIALGLTACINMNAQTTITGSDINPPIGHTSTVYHASYADPGSAGANQTWNLSSMSMSGATQRSYAAGNASYPGTNRTFTQTASNGTVTGYMTMDNAKQEFKLINSGGVTITYSDPMKQVALPLVYNSAASVDNFAATFTTNGMTFNRTGTSTQTVDGYGTLITPEGTFSNVVRVKIVQDYSDVSSMMTIDYDATIYTFYKVGVMDELASVNTITISAGGAQTNSSGTYLEAGTLGLTDEEIGKLSVYPNPVKNNLNISLSENAVKNIFVTDVNGRTFQVEYTQNGSVITLNSEELASGVYFIRVDYSSGQIEQAKIIKE